MKYKRILIFALLVTCFTSYILGQSRNYRPERPMIQQQSEKLRTATGWKLDILGNWVSNENAISDTKLNESNRYSVPQNFKWLQFVQLKNGRQDIYALLYETTAYITATQSERRVYYFLMTSKSYADIVSTINAKTGETYNVQSSSFGYMSDSDGVYTANKLLRLMGQSILEAETTPKYGFNINAQHVDSEDVVRFRLPEQSSAVKDESLKESYFESPLTDFKQILLPVSSQAQTGEFDLGNVTVSPGSIGQSLKDDIEDRTPAKGEQTDLNLSTSNESAEGQLDTVAAIEPTEDSIDDGLSERQAKENAIVSAPIAQFSDIEGWYHSADAGWVNDNNQTYRFETVGKYEFRNLSYRGKDYILLTRFEKYAGSTFYLIDKNEYINIAAGLDRSSMVRFPVVVYAGVGNTLRDMIELCEKTIDTPEKKDAIIFKSNYLVMQYKLSMQKNIARFFIYFQECSKYGSDTSRESCNNKVSSKIKYDDEAILGSDVLFSKAYYESSYNSFMNFFRQPLPTTDTMSKGDDPNQDELDLR